ncbi:CapA family protein [Salinispira pacifica]|uniref:Capsule biosynthesis protein capA n=1 Tax=Salinispira pacifica TaxID=1307761 RepID=V5WME1_9SPIO|nr:CapA family protein [Salinispira pacifica]AHC16813.1 Capsule biosynthesis protein capA [Salinispira pacifica]
MRIEDKFTKAAEKNAELRILFIVLAISLSMLSGACRSGDPPSLPELSGPEHTRGEAAADRTDSVPDLKLSFVGDIMAHPPNFRMNDYSRIYSGISHVIQNDDLSFANMEFVMDQGRAMAGYPRFNVHREYMEAAVDAGFDVFSLANNHINDYGSRGIYRTRNELHLLNYYALKSRRRGIHVSGIDVSLSGEFKITPIRYKGWSIGFLSVTGILNQHWSGVEESYFVPYSSQDENERLREFIRSRSSNYDLFILGYHGGSEYLLYPDQWKYELFHSFMEAGVDILWAHHPHVLQPLEWYPDDETKSGLIMHSMGNFISSQPWYLKSDEWNRQRSYTGDSAILGLSVRMSQGGPEFHQHEILPITHLQHFREKSAGGKPRDGFEVHPTAQSPQVAAEEWENFYLNRRTAMEEFFREMPGDWNIVWDF